MDSRVVITAGETTSPKFDAGHNTNMTLTIPELSGGTTITLYASADGNTFAPLFLDNAASECVITTATGGNTWNISSLGAKWFKLVLSGAQGTNKSIKISGRS